jgi:hypothetical protein
MKRNLTIENEHWGASGQRPHKQPAEIKPPDASDLRTRLRLQSTGCSRLSLCADTLRDEMAGKPRGLVDEVTASINLREPDSGEA